MRPLFSLLLVAALAPLALAGCQYPPAAPPAEFGEAVARNMALQVIDPDPAHPPGPPDFDGARAALMIERYRADEVDEPPGVPAAPGIGIILEPQN